MTLNNISKIDKVSIIALAQMIQNELGSSTIREAAKSLGITIPTEHRNRNILIKKIETQMVNNEADKSSVVEFAKLLIRNLLINGGFVINNNERLSYLPILKEIILTLKSECNTSKRGIRFQDISDLTGIPVETLYGFQMPNFIVPKEEFSIKHHHLSYVWKSAPYSIKKSLDRFYLYIGKSSSEITYSHKEMVTMLSELGVHTPRGPKMPNQGAQVKKKFSPQAIWEGDGKNIKIFINEKLYHFLWYAFTDQTTTLLVGASISDVENSNAFLEAIKNGNYNEGCFPLGILIDNRLGESDLSLVHEFCKEHNISVIKTFPGNSKSNGNIENNFSIFEKYVGQIDISAIS